MNSSTISSNSNSAKRQGRRRRGHHLVELVEGDLPVAVRVAHADHLVDLLIVYTLSSYMMWYNMHIHISSIMYIYHTIIIYIYLILCIIYHTIYYIIVYHTIY